jgi:hypothetical protein
MTAAGSERAIRNLILKAVSGLGARLFRNNVGMGWAGETTHNNGYVIIRNPRPLNAGLVVGSSDLIGWTPVEITQDMVGTTLARFTALEIKTGRQVARPEQTAFLEAVRGAGGIAAVVYGTADAVAAIRAGRQISGSIHTHPANVLTSS